MKILALDTSTEACSVALECDGEMVVDHRIAPQKHAQLLLPMIDAMLSKAGIKTSDLDGVAFGCGPGSFTGVRIAAATAQGIAFGADIGVLPVSSLQVIAQGALREHKATHVLAAIDARMSEVYWGVYAADDHSIVQALQEDRISPPTDVVLSESYFSDANADTNVSWFVVGSGADQYGEELKARAVQSITSQFIPESYPNAQDVLSIALPIAKQSGFLAATNALPVYLRDRVALTEKQRADGERL